MNFSPLKLSQLKWSILTTAHRFPIVILLMFIATTCALWNLLIIDINGPNDDMSFEGFRWAMIIGSGLPLYIGYFIWRENQQWSMRLPRALLFAGIIAIHVYLGMHILSFDPDSNSRQEPFWIVSWLIIIHLIPAILPFWNARKKEDFWSFNYWMLKNFLASSFYIALIYAGIALALSATQLLIFAELSPKFYLLFFFLLVGVFHPIFFLSSSPSEPETINSEGTLLTLQRIQQWILSPLVIVYLSILYLYLGKIVVTATLPKGWVSIWILLFCCIGVLNWLLGQYFKSEKSSRWTITSNAFFWYIIPLIVLLWIAIGYRLLEYGLTETRAIVVYLALFLSLITVYFGFFPKTKLMALPLTLLIIALLFEHGGPISARSLSFQSQLNQWNKIKNQPTVYTASQARDVLSYLSRNHPEHADQFCIECQPENLTIDVVNDYYWANEQLNAGKYAFQADTNDTEVSRIVQFENHQSINLSGFEEMIEITTQERDTEFSNGIQAKINTENVDDPNHQNESMQIQLRRKDKVVHTAFIGEIKTKAQQSSKVQDHSGEVIQEQFSIDFWYNLDQYRFIVAEMNYDTETRDLYYIKGHLLFKPKR